MLAQINFWNGRLLRRFDYNFLVMLQCHELMHICECKKMHKNCLWKDVAISVHVMKVSKYLALCYNLSTASPIRIEISGALYFKYSIDTRYCFYWHEKCFFKSSVFLLEWKYEKPKRETKTTVFASNHMFRSYEFHSKLRKFELLLLAKIRKVWKIFPQMLKF